MDLKDKLEKEINARKKIEHELEAIRHHMNAIMENMPAGIAVLEGSDFRYKSINQKLANMNATSVEAHLGRTLAEILPDAEPDISPGLRKVLETNTPTPPREFCAKMPDDPQKNRWFLDSFFSHL